MIRRPPRSTPLSLHDALPICVRSRPLRRADRRLLAPMVRRSDNTAATRVRGIVGDPGLRRLRSEEHTSELQSRQYLVCRLLLEKKKSPPTILLFSSTTITLLI